MKLGSLQVLRAIAALGVVQAHVDLNLGGFGGTQLGAAGVDLFFVLSGYIITRTAQRDPRDFLKHRALRVLPPWYLALVPWLLVASATGFEWRGLLASLALWPATDKWQMPYLSVGWSLCYEMVFYFSVWLILRGARPRLMLAAYTICIVLSVTKQPIFLFLGSPMVCEFLLGVGIALYAPASKRLGIAAGAAAIAGVGYFALSGDHGLHHPIIAGEPLAWVRVATWGVLAALAVYAAVQFPRTPRWARPAVFLGDASYAIYLTHQTVIAAVVGRSIGLDPVIAFVSCAAVGAVAYLAFERPLLSILRKKPAAAVPAQ